MIVGVNKEIGGPLEPKLLGSSPNGLGRYSANVVLTGL
jgi:hypothetical protein